MGFYDRFDSVRKEYEKFKLEEKRYSAYSSTEFLQSIKGLLEAYEGEEYTVNNDMINCLKFSISPLDSSSLSLKLEIEKQYDDFFMREEDYFILLPSRISKGIKLSKFQQNMEVTYINNFFRQLVEYRYANKLTKLDTDSFADFFNKYLDENKDDIEIYQKTKNRYLELYLEHLKEENIKAGFNVDKYYLINNIKNFINESYDAHLDIFCDVNEAVEGWYSDKDHAYLDYYRTIGLKDNDNIVFEIKEFSYKAEDEIDAYRFNFYYDGSKCVDRDINVYKLKSKMKDLIQKYTKLNKYFFVLDEKYRELLKDNFGIVDGEKIKKLVGKSF